ncbi:L-threonylcarbamoyladenylate synthase [Aquisalinus flavus]|uniref:Threonylcarbamoyl-AMP synthase n=1 Tax=Aquisalinus flavus TaxID=1526572 RepID=A0A8J2V435_9PROT|nr:L-threonylcarbamoyladenylate synthase [Aquisalinus flavus]MBD0427226.1 threonylcarbamoyl-AMP synthase [Aquisalinus flavus]UNE47041.1 threonylcarbamoyl-AMP synthase [Aquisalinus flavus]GGC99329.1 threonylcarbamoyl-AMP synthase [Aquisalinus flavus]
MSHPIVAYSPEAAGQAARILSDGGLVAVPTETVYGLAADATDDRAVARIYEAKGRPSFNPLIIHVTGLEMASRYAVISPLAETLAAAFWPGPLTMVLPVRPDSGLSTLVTAGLDTVAIRCPQSLPAQAILAALGRPFAAPSANPSGGLSPTSAAHVAAALGEKVDMILDDGPSSVGVESTIIAVGETLTLLRPGSITVAQIEKITGQGVEVKEQTGTILAPGMMESHYAPKALLRLNATAPETGEAFLGFGATTAPGALNLSPSGDLTEAAANLFAFLHRLDDTANRIAVAPIPDTGLGIAINDRLRRAAAPR